MLLWAILILMGVGYLVRLIVLVAGEDGFAFVMGAIWVLAFIGAPIFLLVEALT